MIKPPEFRFFLLRACSESPRVRMAKPDFSPDEAKIAGNTLCINENFGKIWRERCKPDVRGEILNRLLQQRRPDKPFRNGWNEIIGAVIFILFHFQREALIHFTLHTSHFTLHTKRSVTPLPSGALAVRRRGLPRSGRIQR